MAIAMLPVDAGLVLVSNHCTDGVSDVPARVEFWMDSTAGRAAWLRKLVEDEAGRITYTTTQCSYPGHDRVVSNVGIQLRNAVDKDLARPGVFCVVSCWTDS